jgi:hypothetical protein
MKTKFITRRATSLGAHNTFGDFVCMHCRNFVSAEAALSGVHNRNHCPYCLSSRHLDLFEAGDRLSACKARMRPVGLTLKKSPKKYAGKVRGELMLVHQCEECGRFAINRIAADDDNEALLKILSASENIDHQINSSLATNGITPLLAGDLELVYSQLYGCSQ